jgi:hypothetical protein
MGLQQARIPCISRGSSVLEDLTKVLYTFKAELVSCQFKVEELGTFVIMKKLN